MLTLLSPAKNLDFNPQPGAPAATRPLFLKEAAALAAIARELSPARLKTLMGVSEKLAALNCERFQTFRGDGLANAQKSAVLAFNGEVYQGLAAKTMSAADFKFAQEHLRILSGLYGLLRPLDAIEPYRLEMGLALKNPKGKDLYAWWGARLAEEINKAVKGHKDPTIVNLASTEYFSAVDPAVLEGPVVTPCFKEEKNGKLHALQFFAKRARGLMARWIIDARIERAADLKAFNGEGYLFRAGLSGGQSLVFTRPQLALKGKGKAKAA